MTEEGNGILHSARDVVILCFTGSMNRKKGSRKRDFNARRWHWNRETVVEKKSLRPKIAEE